MSGFRFIQLQEGLEERGCVPTSVDTAEET